MTHFRTAVISVSATLTFAAGFAFAQGEFTFPRRIDPELVAARQSLNAAMMHLQNTTNPDVVQIVRARAYILLAASELQGQPGVQPGAE